MLEQQIKQLREEGITNIGRPQGLPLAQLINLWDLVRYTEPEKTDREVLSLRVRLLHQDSQFRRMG